MYTMYTSFKEWTWNHVLYILLFLHFICLPAAIVASIIAGLNGIAITNGIAFLLLLGVWAVLWKE